MPTWTNPDGLTLVYGTDRAKLSPVGEHKFDGPRRCVEIKFNTTELPAFGSSVVISDKIALPVGATIENAEIIAYTDFTSAGTPLFDIGTIDMDGTSNADDDSIVDAATMAEMNGAPADGAAYAGVLCYGAKLTTAKYLTWAVAAANYTAGDGVVRIYYSVD